MGLVRELLDIFPVRDTAHDQDCFHTRFYPTDDVRIHPVANHDGFFGMDAQLFKPVRIINGFGLPMK